MFTLAISVCHSSTSFAGWRLDNPNLLLSYVMALSKPFTDPFSKLPRSVAMAFWKYLDNEDRLHLSLASPHVRRLVEEADLSSWKMGYTVAVRQRGGGGLLQHLKTEVSFTYPDEMFTAAFKSLFDTPCYLNDILVAVASEQIQGEDFARFVEAQSIPWLHVHRSGGYVSKSTRSALRSKNAVVLVVTHRADGYLPKPKKVVMLMPQSSYGVHSIIHLGVRELKIMWPLLYHIQRQYEDVKSFFKRHDRANCPMSVAIAKPEFQVIPEGTYLPVTA